MNEAESLLARIRGENHRVYADSPIRVQEDASQEEQIADDYKGRLVFELLQNADDAMQGSRAEDDTILFRLYPRELVVANTGRALTEGDVVGLCGTGAGTKTPSTGNRRASIGHKGMGFKSVLEITDAPEVRSSPHGFRMDRALAAAAVDAALAEAAETARGAAEVSADGVPVMRFPWPLTGLDRDWEELQERGFNTSFRFPLRDSVTLDRWSALADGLVSLPVSAILFLKHLERVHVEVREPSGTRIVRWSITRHRRRDSGWEPAAGLGASGVYRVRIREERDSAEARVWQFLIAHDGDVEIGDHRIGLVGNAWKGVKYTEVSVATPWPTGAGAELDEGWQRFHVFLPTEEVSPYPLIINGAFSTDLSRRRIDPGKEPASYNRHLLRQAAALFRDRLVPELLSGGAGVPDILSMLDRSLGGGAAELGAILHQAMREFLAELPLVPTESHGTVPVTACAVPPVSTSRQSMGAEMRSLLGPGARLGDWLLPVRELCRDQPARVLADLGAHPLTPVDCVRLLADADPLRSRAIPHPSANADVHLKVDPVLSVLEDLLDCPGGRSQAVQDAVRSSPVFPVEIRPDGTVVRVGTTDKTRFYPPRTLAQAVPLDGLAFIATDLCWGGLSSRQRPEVIGPSMSAWQALFDMRDFKFPAVMQASVLRLLVDLAPGEEDEVRAPLMDKEILAAICQLSGNSPNPTAPLPYERLGPNRTLSNLSRLPVPCARKEGGGVRWVPAYRAYFSAAWTRDGSIERLLDAMREAGCVVPDLPLLVGPEELVGLLAKYDVLRRAMHEDAPDSGEVSLDEDEDHPVDEDERKRWMRFLQWVGVNKGLRLVPLHDVDDRGQGWIATANFRRPNGHAFQSIGNATWEKWVEPARRASVKARPGEGTRYLYEVHDIEAAGVIPAAAKADIGVAKALFRHLGRNWDVYERFVEARAALVEPGKVLGQRARPIKPWPQEEHGIGENLWLYRLRRVSWVPTSQGPQHPARVWMPSQEITRRFGRRGARSGDLIPTVLVPDEPVDPRVRAMAADLRLREVFAPSTFTRTDAEALMRRIEAVYRLRAKRGTLADNTLRYVIRPAYSNLFELLAGQAGEEEEDGREGTVDASLASAPVLASDGHHNYRFMPAQDVFYMSRSGTRDRLSTDAAVWTLVNEVSVTRRKPLSLLGVRVLEDALKWKPDAVTSAFDDDGELVRFREGLRDLAPFILRRLRADRPDGELARRDASRLGRLVKAVEPVRTLSLTCKLDGQVISRGSERGWFVDSVHDDSPQAYLRWGELGWPPSEAEAEDLSGLFVDALEAGAFESFLALARAEGDASRERLLRRSGAPADLDDGWEIETPPEGGDEVLGRGPEQTPGAGGDVEPVDGGSGEVAVLQVHSVTKNPLYRSEDLVFDGETFAVWGPGRREGSATGGEKGGGGSGGSGRDSGTGYGGKTDVAELDRVGMAIALRYERLRLARAGGSDGSTMGGAGLPDFIFDTSTLEARAAASEESPEFREAFAQLQRLGVRAAAPGFDILTLDPVTGLVQRLIELKSSGVNAQTQSMSWNEWNTAAAGGIRSSFYLYLVGNLRADLTDGLPFIRTIHDPFGTLWGQVTSESAPRRSVQLNVLEFDHADEQRLTVHPAVPPEDGH